MLFLGAKVMQSCHNATGSFCIKATEKRVPGSTKFDANLLPLGVFENKQSFVIVDP